MTDQVGTCEEIQQEVRTYADALDKQKRQKLDFVSDKSKC